jgi:hypothetical protein
MHAGRTLQLPFRPHASALRFEDAVDAQSLQTNAGLTTQILPSGMLTRRFLACQP